jgi:hypothetical protein
MIVYRHADPRFPFLWEGNDQPPGRWHGPERARSVLRGYARRSLAEFLRHEGISEESDLVNVRRALWAIELPDDLHTDAPRLSQPVLTGGIATYRACQEEARLLRAKGANALRAPSAALLPGGARGWKVDGGLQPADERDGIVLGVFGPCPKAVGWAASFVGRPRSDLVSRVRHL